MWEGPQAATHFRYRPKLPIGFAALKESMTGFEAVLSVREQRSALSLPINEAGMRWGQRDATQNRPLPPPPSTWYAG